MARIERLLLCLSLFVLLLTPCSFARGLRDPGTESLLGEQLTFEEQLSAWRKESGGDNEVPTSFTERSRILFDWATASAETSLDYSPPTANSDPTVPLPSGF